MVPPCPSTLRGGLGFAQVFVKSARSQVPPCIDRAWAPEPAFKMCCPWWPGALHFGTPLQGSSWLPLLICSLSKHVLSANDIPRSVLGVGGMTVKGKKGPVFTELPFCWEVEVKVYCRLVTRIGAGGEAEGQSGAGEGLPLLNTVVRKTPLEEDILSTALERVSHAGIRGREFQAGHS